MLSKNQTGQEQMHLLVKEDAASLLETLQNKEWVEEKVRLQRISEFIFSANDLPFEEIINVMARYKYMNVEYKIAFPDRKLILGSQQVAYFGR